MSGTAPAVTDVPAAPALVLVGGGEHARVVADAARAAGVVRLVGYVDPQAPAGAGWSLPWLGPDAWLRDHPGHLAVLGVGAVGVSPRRAAIVASLAPHVAGWAAVVHPRAVVAPGVTLGEGAVVMAGAIVQPGARIGPHAVVNTGAVVEHDCVLGPFAQLGPGAVLGGGVEVGEGAFVGLGARVRDHRRVGRAALVGLGAAVVRDVPDGSVVAGVPARPLLTPAGSVAGR